MAADSPAERMRTRSSPSNTCLGGETHKSSPPRPLVAMQSLDNAQDVTVCRNCLGFVGDIVSQLEILSGLHRHACAERFQERHGGNDPAAALPTLTGIYPCLQSCGEVYCSPDCRDDHFKRGHRLLCVGPISEEDAETHPLVAFKFHAVRTNEIFLLVGEVVAQILTACDEHVAGAHKGDPEAALTAAGAPFSDFVQHAWWDVAAPREPYSSEGAEHVRLSGTLRSLCAESSALLRDALRPSHAVFDAIFQPQKFGEIIGMFEQNNVGIRAPSPIFQMLNTMVGAKDIGKSYLGRVAALLIDLEDNYTDESSSEDEGDTCADLPDQAISKAKCNGMCAESCSRPKTLGDLVEAPATEGDPVDVVKNASEEAGSLFAPLDGTALYSLICCMNHSCRPNCEVRYLGRRRGCGESVVDPLVAQVVLIEDVGAGEELTQSYIDKDMSVGERRKALTDYGFVCTCPRCIEEMS